MDEVSIDESWGHLRPVKLDIDALDHAVQEVLSAASPHTPGFVPMTRAQKEWARVRGVFRMGVLHEAKKSK